MRVSGKPLVRFPYALGDASSHVGLTQRVRSQVGVFAWSTIMPSDCTSLTVTEVIGPTRKI